MRFLSIHCVVLVLEPSSFWRGSRRHTTGFSENVVVAEASHQILGYWKFYHLKITVLNLSGEKECSGASGVSIF